MVLRYVNDPVYAVAKGNGSCTYWEKGAEVKKQMILSTDGEVTAHGLMVPRRMAGLGGRDVRVGTAEEEWDVNDLISCLLGMKDFMTKLGKMRFGEFGGSLRKALIANRLTAIKGN